jgi:hypothetical protein
VVRVRQALALRQHRQGSALLLDEEQREQGTKLIYEHAGCRELFRTSLFFVGAFGVNDYLLALGNKTAPQVRTLVPDVIATISTAIKVSK